MNIQRILINNGFTIANRRQLRSSVGYNKYQELAAGFKSYLKSPQSIDIPVEAIKLLRDIRGLWLKIAVEPIIDKNIYLSQFVDSNDIKSFIKESIYHKKTDINFNRSKTMEKLFSVDFAPERHTDGNGYFVTTIIDKKTGQPVEAYVRLENSYMLNDESIETEIWTINVKNPETNSYERVGRRHFEVSYKDNKILPGYMESKEGRDKYAGIGIRLHQIGVERLIQDDLDSIVIDAVSEAFPFHYKCGFRTCHQNEEYGKQDFNNQIIKWSKILGISPLILKKRVKIKDLENERCSVDYKDFENLKKELCTKMKGEQDFRETKMELYGKELKRWIRLAESQPIILSYKKEFF